MKNHDCPVCDGTGKQTIKFSYHGEPEKDHESEITCVICDGEKKVDQETLDMIEYEKNMWCKCEEDTDAKYYSDGQHPEIHKHHWRCTSCDKVKQIG